MISLSTLLASCRSSQRANASYQESFQKGCPNQTTLWKKLAPPSKLNRENPEKTQWLKSNPSQEGGVVLLLHGLNLKPSKMDAIGKVLTQQGHAVLRAALSGHRGDLKEQQSLTHRDWVLDMHHLYCLASLKSQQWQRPLYVVAFSLGALVFLDYLNQGPDYRPHRLFLMAPAHTLHWYAHLPEYLDLLSDSFGLPSQNLKEYRSQASTSLAAYRAMEAAREGLFRVQTKNLNLPTIVFLDPEDELINLKKIKSFLAKNSLTRWSLELTSNRQHQLQKSFHHLIIDKKTLGEREWKRLIRLLKNHLVP